MDERLLELAAGIEEWVVGDWAFQKNRNPAGTCIDKLYLHLCKTMKAKQAGSTAIFLTMKGIISGMSYESIIEATTGEIKTPA